MHEHCIRTHELLDIEVRLPLDALVFAIQVKDRIEGMGRIWQASLGVRQRLRIKVEALCMDELVAGLSKT